MILVAGGIADKVTELVCSRLDACGYPYRLFDLGRYPAAHGMSVRWGDDIPSGSFSGPDWQLGTDEISGAYVRFLGAEGRVLPNDLPEPQASQLQLEADTALLYALDALPCPVVNRLGGGMSNNSKPHQLLLIARAGLEVPPTLVTNDPDAVHTFHARHGQLIYKSASGVRSIVRRLDAEQLSRLVLLRNGPAQFQARIFGCNVRVHVVGDQLFATRIRSAAIDYRYASREGATVEMEPTELPPLVAAACLKVSRDLGLLHSGIDLIETPDHHWYCFEVNPCPGFIFFERGSGQPISLALAELLHAGSKSAERASRPSVSAIEQTPCVQV
jgi:glutathione synthase/RimK-type ligase-like ATP-grasp enzyme